MTIRFSSFRHHSLPRACGVALLALALVDCASSPTAEQAARSGGTTGELQQLLDKAHSSPLDTRARYLLDAADAALRERQAPAASQILKELGELKLTPPQHARSRVQTARLQLLQGKPLQTIDTLQERTLLQEIDQLSTEQQADVSLLRAQALAETGKYYASALERVFVDPLLQGAAAEKNRADLWQALLKVDSAELQRNRDKTNDGQLRGWLDLAIAARAGKAEPKSTTAWSQQFPASTAAGDNVALRDIKADQSGQVALLLPLSGKLSAFGEAVRDGFFAAYFAAKQRGEALPNVRLYDSDGGGIVALYQQAVGDGATTVIGPLEKIQVAQFYAQSLPVPLLALNRADSEQPAPANLYQFSLAPEDEAAQLADIAARRGGRNALIIAAEDESRSRELQAFTQRWQSLGGRVAGTALYRDQQSMSMAIRSALNIPRSEARGKEMETVLNRNIEFTPHRRRDIDTVFMLAKPAQARSIKPLLNFYYAGDLPVYSTSRIYNGYPGTLDRDLERVRFTEIPWILQQPELKQQIAAAQPNSRNYLRLYALGIDSFGLYPRLRQLETMGDRRVDGQTGALSLDAQRIVQRQSLLAEMRNGGAVQIDVAPRTDAIDARENGDETETTRQPQP